jgi:5-methylcytosine-specific restriction endonuclease McrA
MIRIKKDNLDEIAEEYFGYLEKWLDIDNSNGNFNKEYNKVKNSVKDKPLFKKFENQFKKISKQIKNKHFILASPDDIARMKERSSSTNPSKEFATFMAHLYNQFFQSKTPDGEILGYWLIKRLGLRTCPYCNREYTFCVSKGKTKTRPQFDHFYPKKKYPCFALCFYNLVPSCPICNKAKGENEISYNPYKEGFPYNQRFKLTTNNMDLAYITPDSEVHVQIENSDNNKNVRQLLLNELYDQHADIAKEILFKARAYNDSFYDSVIKSFQGAGCSKGYIDNLIWGTYLDEANEGRKPFSKLTKDILDQIGK